LLIGYDVKTHVRILIDGTGNQAWHGMVLAEDLRERVGEGRCSLDSDKVIFANVVTVRNQKPYHARSVNDILFVGRTVVAGLTIL
jgi:hypothetical protein